MLSSLGPLELPQIHHKVVQNRNKDLHAKGSCQSLMHFNVKQEVTL